MTDERGKKMTIEDFAKTLRIVSEAQYPPKGLGWLALEMALEMVLDAFLDRHATPDESARFFAAYKEDPNGL